MKDKRPHIIWEARRQGGTFTLDDAVRWIGQSYYANERKHTGEVLTRMVRAGMLHRVRPGVFVLIRSTPRKGSATLPEPDGTLSLF